ncbi:hypothetical protein SUDANB96_06545 [Streptomyces sp. enrichment culture]
MRSVSRHPVGHGDPLLFGAGTSSGTNSAEVSLWILAHPQLFVAQGVLRIGGVVTLSSPTRSGC